MAKKGTSWKRPKRDNYIGECEVSPDCLRCPLEQCKHDDPQWYHRWRKEQRDAQIADRKAEGATAQQIADQADVTVRTVQRWMSPLHQ